MEKIIELLNDYIPEGWSIEHGGKSIFYEGVNYNDRIIGKDFGFIKRLVENDKIDKKKFEDNFFVCGCCGYKLLSTRETCEACGDEVLDIYEALLMRLAIQYEPLKFLISILK